jgi:signal transduction histidine kinase
VLASGGRDEAAALLATAAVDVVGAQGALVLEVQLNAELKAVARAGVAEELGAWTGDSDLVGPELAAALHQAWGEAGGSVQVLPLVSGTRLFGALALFFVSSQAPASETIQLARGLVDLVASALDKSTQFDDLRRAHERLAASQAMLVRSEKLRALGQMAAGIAHDLKNLLNPLSLQLDVIERAARRGDTTAINEKVQQAKAVIRRGTETIERLRYFSRQAPEQGLEAADLNRMAKEALELARPRSMTRDGSSTLVEQLGEVPPIAARPSEIVNAVLNLIVNALDAKPSGGTVIVRTAEGERGGAEIQVIDDGPGMTPEVLAHASEPFFTTKGDLGTGLGLAMVRSCMDRHRGHMTISSVPGQSTCVSLWFPRAGSASEEPAQDSSKFAHGTSVPAGGSPIPVPRSS